MAMYGIALLPLIELVKNPKVTSKWYADDSNVAGSMDDLKVVHDKLTQHGSAFGYTLTKCNIITKTENVNQAEKLFSNSDLEIVEEHRVLGSVIDSESSWNEYKLKKQNEFIEVVEKLSKHAKISPQNAYHCFTKGPQNKLTFLSRTTPAILENLQEAEKRFENKLIPALTGKQYVSEDDRPLFSLPVRDGGLNISLSEDRLQEINWSREMSSCLKNDDAELQQTVVIKQIGKKKPSKIKEKTTFSKDRLHEHQRYALDLAAEKGASSWLNTLPLKRYHFDLTKTEFRDSLGMRNGWEPLKIPVKCPCGDIFSLSPSLQCNKCGYTQMRHDEIRNTFAAIMKEVCFDVEIEPKLPPL